MFSIFHVFISSMFLFLQMLLLLIVRTSFMCCYRECYGFERTFFTLMHFLPYTPSQHLAQPAFIKASLGWQFSFEGCRVSHWRLKHRLNPSVCLNHTVFGNYMISRKLYLNLSKYFDKLLLGKSFINFTNLILVHVILLISFY